MRWILRWLVRIAVAIPIAAVGLWLSLEPGDPDLFPAIDRPQPVWVVDHGWHSGIVIGQAELRAAAIRIGRDHPAEAERLRWLTTRFPGAEWLEIGWGDAEFYRETPTVADVDVTKGLTALFLPTDSALQVVPGWGVPTEFFASSPSVVLPLSRQGFDEMARKLAETIVEPAPSASIGKSLYGNGAFYPARLDYHMFRTCNHWVSSLLRAAGVPSSAVPATFSRGLMGELKMRESRNWGKLLPQF